jgi:beta-glucosidase
MEPLRFLSAGGDLSLDVMGAWGMPGHAVAMLKAAEDPATAVWVTKALQRASRNILYAVSRSWKM